MSGLGQWWANLGSGRRAGLVGGALLVVALVAAAGYALLRTDWQVLFADLAPADAATMVAELERMKARYRIDEGAGAILVAREDVHALRLKLVNKELPLRGAVGFELFSQSDFGMTEFAQRVNYQRALQGELTRTIMAIEDVSFARVHLALPEQGLFRKAASKPKASVTVAMKPGRVLRAEQVAGIQRLVSAAIPDIAPRDVTIVGQSGVALSRAGGDGEVEVSAGRLDAKRAAEDYLARKAQEVLERALGAQQAMVSVDVVLNHDQSRVTTEDVLPARPDDAKPAGVIVRSRSLLRDPGASASAVADGAARTPSGHVEVDYQVGRRTEQVVTAPGAIQRLAVAIVVRAPADKAQLERVKKLVSMAVGLDEDRGDGIVVYSMEQLAGSTPAAALPVADLAAPVPAAPAPAPAAEPRAAESSSSEQLLRRAAAPLLAHAQPVVSLLLLVAAAVAWAMVRQRRNRRARSGAAPALTPAQRQALLADVRAWVGSR